MRIFLKHQDRIQNHHQTDETDQADHHDFLKCFLRFRHDGLLTVLLVYRKAGSLSTILQSPRPDIMTVKQRIAGNFFNFGIRRSLRLLQRRPLRSDKQHSSAGGHQLSVFDRRSHMKDGRIHLLKIADLRTFR